MTQYDLLKFSNRIGAELFLLTEANGFMMCNSISKIYIVFGRVNIGFQPFGGNSVDIIFL